MLYDILGSFKLRGIANQINYLPEEVKKGEKKLITMSAGNYGKAFAYTLQKIDLAGLCLMPITAPQSRVELIKVTFSCKERKYQHGFDDYLPFLVRFKN